MLPSHDELTPTGDHAPDVRRLMRCVPGPGLRGTGGHWGREPGPGRDGAVLYWPLPATRSQGIIIAITQDLYQAVVSTSLFVMLCVSATMAMSLESNYQLMNVGQGN